MNEIIKVDVLVIGGGPAGVMSAIAAHNENPELNIIIVEKGGKFPGHKIGEALLTSTIMDFHREGIAKEVLEAARECDWQDKYGASYVYGVDRTPWTVPNTAWRCGDDNGYPDFFQNEKGRGTLMVKRHELDAHLIAIAERRGIRVIAGTVREIKMHGEVNGGYISRVTIDSDEGQKDLLPLQVIDCSGWAALVANKLSIRERNRLLPVRAARYIYVKDMDFSRLEKAGMPRHHTNILRTDYGWTWIIHTGNGVTSIGIVDSVENWKAYDSDFFKRLTAMPEYDLIRFPAKQQCDFTGAESSEVFVRSDYSYAATTFYGVNWLLAGDAAAFLDPILSQGVSLAVHFGSMAGHAAAKRISGDECLYENYERSYRSELKILAHLVGMWYLPKADGAEAWRGFAQNVSENIYGRKVGVDIQAFQWVTNLENLHLLFHDEIGDDEIIQKLQIGETSAS